MIRRRYVTYHTQPPLPTSPPWLTGITLAAFLFLAASILRQQLPATLAIAQSIARASESCSGYAAETAPSSLLRPQRP